ncbi:MAG: VOC family protein [Pseudohongiella sp.]|uniref:VOC family protein n=1 Tax=Pseudohongiella sp. TaxID=1979412 RepID=UPI00349FFC0A
MSISHRVSPCLWFDTQAEEAANFYIGIFKNAAITRISRYGEAGFEFHQRPAGSVMVVEFVLDGQTFTALNGGPVFKFSEAISFQINCDTQAEIDHYWQQLGDGGPAEAQQCGWLKDRFGVSWQVVPKVLGDMMTDADPVKVQKVTEVMLRMKKLDIAALQHAYDS